MPELASTAKPTGFKVVGFALNVDGKDIQFSQLTEISSEMELVEYGGGAGEKVTEVKWLPGKRKPPTLVLTRPLSADRSVATWHEAAVAGDITKARKDGVLSILGPEGKPLTRYTLEGAWPAKIEISGSSGGAALVETVTLTCERLERLAS